jgi:cytochrome c556
MMKRSLVIVAAVMLIGNGTVIAQQDLITQGQMLMKSNGRNMGAVLGAMAKGDKPFDQAAVDAALAQLEDTAKQLPTLYPDSTKGMQPTGDFRLTPKIYEDRAGWSAAIENFAKAVNTAKANIKDLDTLKASVPGIGKECSACHESFRAKNG